MKKCLIFLLASLCLQLSLNGQDSIKISGKIIDDSGNPIIFGTVYSSADNIGTESNLNGYYTIAVKDTTSVLEFSYVGFLTQKQRVGQRTTINVTMKLSEHIMDEVVITAYKAPLISMDCTSSGAVVTSRKIRNLPSKIRNAIAATTSGISVKGSRKDASAHHVDAIRRLTSDFDGERYEFPTENQFILSKNESLSTFAVDVDRAAYSNIRRFIQYGQLPPEDAVRIEEMINYFDYNYPEPSDLDLFNISHQLTVCPWNKQHQVLHVALNTKNIDKKELDPSNLVFLLDVSGSMNQANKLPLVKSSLKLLIDQLRPEDKIAIVVYAGSAGCVLESTSVSEKQKILQALNNLNAGGSTAGGAGIKLAYKIAKESFIKGGNNRVILATDGDFNVGINNPDGLEKLIEKKKKDNIFLTVLGYGMGNYRDDMVQRLADKGNGMHAYINDMHEARKILVNEFTGSMYTVAKDVKVQIEFNPAFVQAYRLIGYENRMLEKEDFNDDRKDGGEVGIGHSITALYEIIPKGIESDYIGKVDELVFQENPKPIEFNNFSQIAWLKIRYKDPQEETSERMDIYIPSKIATIEKSSPSMRFAMAVAQFGLILRESAYKSAASYDSVLELAGSALSNDSEGERHEFVKLVKTASVLDDRIVAR